MAGIYDIGFFMLDKTMNEANNMKENGLGDAWEKRVLKQLPKTK